jgi:hypothetical protein
VGTFWYRPLSSGRTIKSTTFHNSKYHNVLFHHDPRCTVPGGLCCLRTSNGSSYCHQNRPYFLYAWVGCLSIQQHANEGCITVNYVPVCAPESVDAYAGRATIHARFSGSISDKIIVNAGCQLNAKWPVGWGDIYFGADNCLYDSSGTVN